MGRKKMSEPEQEVEQNGAVATEEKPPKRVESKRQRFVRLIHHRMPRALKALKAIENLGNKSQYDFTESESEKIVTDLSAAVQRIGHALSEGPAVSSGWRL